MAHQEQQRHLSRRQYRLWLRAPLPVPPKTTAHRRRVQEQHEGERPQFAANENVDEAMDEAMEEMQVYIYHL